MAQQQQHQCHKSEEINRIYDAQSEQNAKLDKILDLLSAEKTKAALISDRLQRISAIVYGVCAAIGLGVLSAAGWALQFVISMGGKP